jgi:hypothetical protein
MVDGWSIFCHLRVSTWVSFVNRRLTAVSRTQNRTAAAIFLLAFTMAAELEVDRFLKRLSKLHSHFLKHK